MTCKNLPIIEVDHGIANRFSDHIEINKNLKNYPDIMKAVLGHELSHTDAVWSWEDFKLDMFTTQVPPTRMAQFIIQNPKAITQLLPIYYTKGQLIYDINLGIIYLIFGGLTFLTCYLALKII